VRVKSKLSPNYLILVLDSHTAFLLQQMETNIYDLLKQKVYQMEDLNKSRKRYPMSDVLYFIAPTEEAVNLVLKDFPEQDDFDYDQYGTVHLSFCAPCPENLLTRIA